MKKLFYNFILFSLLTAITLSCAGCVTFEDNKATAQIFALDTVIELTAYGKHGEDALTAAKDKIYALEKLFSVTNTNSDIYRINTSQDEFVTVSEDVYKLTEEAVSLNILTEGNFDITLYNILKLWGFTTKEYRVPSDEELRDTLDKTGVEKISLKNSNQISVASGCALDLGGIAKGYIADKASDAMKEAGADYGLISLGGNIRTVGEKDDGTDWIVGVRHPDVNEPFLTVSAKECSVITSGAYQRNFEVNGSVYHHIINPKTGKPSESDALSVTIIGNDGALCDALSTALFVGGTEYAQKLYESNHSFEYVILATNNTVYASKGLEGKLTLTSNYQNLNIIYR